MASLITLETSTVLIKKFRGTIANALKNIYSVKKILNSFLSFFNEIY
jgi:hypothetical protein